MFRKSFLATVVGVVGLAVVVIDAGGWAVITVSSVPDAIMVGRPMPLEFTVRQHGMTPLGGLHPTVEAVLGEGTVTFAAKPATGTGTYRATMTLPRAGQWVLTIKSGFGQGSQLTLMPISAVARSASASPPLSAADRGKQLFVAKGCVTCHQNTLGTANQSLGIGPLLIPQKYQPEFLARILEDPVGTLPARRDAVVGAMPDLDLQPTEIASLVAFINTTGVTAAR